MDFTTQIVIFIALTGFTVIFNTILIWLVYKGFATTAMKLTTSVAEFESNRATREWLRSMLSASERAVTMTELAQRKMAEFDPSLEDLQARCGFVLAQIDTRVERVTTGVSDNVTRVRDAIVKPAEQFGEVASGVASALGFFLSSDGDSQEE
jgi:hypothetical protein